MCNDFEVSYSQTRMLKLLVRYGGIMNIFLLTIKEFCASKAHWHGACLHCLYLVF